MGKNKSKSMYKQTKEPSIDEIFMSHITTFHDGLPAKKIENQKNAIKNAIEQIKKAAAEGKKPEDIETMLMNNMKNLFERINNPSLEDFYQARTYEYLYTIDLKPYVEELLVKKINPLEYEQKNVYTANLEANILLALCVGLKYFLRININLKNPEFELLCSKIKKNELTIEDQDVILKYIKRLMKEIKCGKSALWAKQRQDIKKCMKLFYKYRDVIFEVQKPRVNGTNKSVKRSNGIANKTKTKGIEELKSKIGITSLMPLNNQYSVTTQNTDYYLNDDKKPIPTAKIKKFIVNPFMSENSDNNFLCIMNETLSEIEFDEQFLGKLYIVISKYTPGDSKKSEESNAVIVEALGKFFKMVRLGKDITQVKEMLMERVCALTAFFKAAGLLDAFGEKNNRTLERVYLGDLTINMNDLFSKYITNIGLEDSYFVDKNTRYDGAYKGTPMSITCDEAVAGLSTFYTNRMTKCADVYTALPFILKKKNVIARICENPELSYDDLGFSDESIAIYMSVYACLQRLIINKYLLKQDDESKISEFYKYHDEIVAALEKYRYIYETMYPGMGFNFEADIDFAAIDAMLINALYDIKDDCVKLLLYTAITDNKKNILNWGFVPEDENTDERFVLLGFDIKSLSSPLFVHIKRDELVEFIEELTAKHELQVYEGANDVYSYSIRNRINTQVLYPLSKDERRKLAKLNGIGNQTDYYKHICWLQQNGIEPLLAHKPGSRVYNFDTNTIVDCRNRKPQVDAEDR